MLHFRQQVPAILCLQNSCSLYVLLLQTLTFFGNVEYNADNVDLADFKAAQRILTRRHRGSMSGERGHKLGRLEQE